MCFNYPESKELSLGALVLECFNGTILNGLTPNLHAIEGECTNVLGQHSYPSAHSVSPTALLRAVEISLFLLS